MPYCENCDKYHAPSAMNADGTCPVCGAQVADPADVEAAAQQAEDEKAPWHFKLLVVLLVVYLGWRFYQLLF